MLHISTGKTSNASYPEQKTNGAGKIKRIKNDFIRALIGIGLTGTDADRIMCLFIENITSGLKHKKEVFLINFGKFKVVKKKKNSFINPKTKEISFIKGENRVKFIPSKNLTKYINDKDRY